MVSTSIDEKVNKDNLEAKLKNLAEEISADLAQLDSSQGKVLLSDFVSELFFNMAKQNQREFRRRKQAEGIAAAKARGVRFGPEPKPLPDNFDVYYEAWQNGEMTVTQAAQACGLSRRSFYRATARKKQDADYVV